MAYQPKSYRKFLATSVAAAVVVTAAAPAALAAPADAKFSDVSSSHWAIKDINYLVEKGAIQGYPDGTFKPGNSITRAEIAVVLAKTLDLDVDPEVTTDKFSDVPATHWANPYIAAIVDQTEGVIDGYENGTFRPSNTVTRQEMAKMVVEAYDLELVEGKDLPFTDVDGLWSTDYINILASNGVAAGMTTTTFVPRGEVQRAQTAAFVHRAEVEEERIEVPDLPVDDTELAVESVSAITAKSLEVTFNQAVDPEKAKFAVKRGAASVNVADITFKEDNKTAVVELSTKFVKADYAVTISGLTEEAIVKEFSTEAEKVSSIEIPGDTAAATYSGSTINGATIAYQVKNQYGEDVTDQSLASNLSWTPSAGTATDNNNGTLTLAGAYSLDQNVTVTAVDSTSGTVLTKAIKIGSAAVVDEVTLSSLYHADNKELNTGSTFDEFNILLDAKDQYGNTITSVDKLTNDLIVTSSNPSVVDVKATTFGEDGAVTSTPFVSGQGEDGNKFAIELKAPANPMAGTANIRVISKSTGKITTFAVTVAETSKVDTLTLAQPTAVVATDETVQIPFEAFDQFGDAVTNFASLKDLTVQSTGGSVQWKNDFVNRKAVLEFTAPATKGDVILTAFTSTGKVSQITVKVEEGRTAAVVSNASALASTVVVDGTTTLRARDITVQDQHGRTFPLAAFFGAGNQLNVTVKDNTSNVVSLSKSTLTSATDTLTITGEGTGTKRIVVSVDGVDASAFEFSVRTVAKSAVTEFGIGEVANIQNADNYEVDFDVHGLLNGSKVGLTSDMYAVTATDGLVYENGKLKLDSKLADTNFGTDGKKEATVTVQFDSSAGLVTQTKKVTIVNEESKLTAINLDSTDLIEIKNGVAEAPVNFASVENLLALFEGEDQFGNDLALSSPTVFVSSVKDANGAAKVTSNFVTGNGTVNAAFAGTALTEGYTLTFAVTSNGITKSIPVVIVEAAEVTPEPEAPAPEEPATFDELTFTYSTAEDADLVDALVDAFNGLEGVTASAVEDGDNTVLTLTFTSEVDEDYEVTVSVELDEVEVDYTLSFVDGEWVIVEETPAP
ncbi:S-layer homology domain-containing protein [Alkalihalophilus pseudofirmus]|uniref:S-layer homology domain-containing protein n=1 Tax=Alkalihalophilus pseudofirmus TaxID=79885 RepID=UPI00259B9089|nr:S-layer homology domain-containing protein [Alkalihalophilus pseudofirmus]WEG16712.1 S-layer homology domain-containing protein [Alkalihalophilus pseudofirmus]